MKKIILTIMGILISLNASANADEYCNKKETNLSMSYTDARAIAAKSECAKSADLLSDHWCNEITGTWWIKVQPHTPNPACRPACVIDIAAKTASINWMCMGLLPEKDHK